MIRVMGTIYNGNRTEWSPILSGVQTRHRLYVFIKKIKKKRKKKTSVNSSKCETTARAHDAFCPHT